MFKPNSIARRRFLRQSGSAAVLAGFWAWGAQPARGRASGRLRIAAIGVGNRGETNVLSVRDEQVVALCDVDERYLDERRDRFPQARRYRDYRELLDRESLDAVLISSPDHTHAHAALLAIGKGLHVYCEKPLAATVAEVRRLAAAAAARTGVVTQTGNQHHSSAGYRRAVQLVQAGVLGDVDQVHVWTDRPFWPQGMTGRPPAQTPPAYLDWDLWLGTAPARPYSDGYHPGNWRGYWDFGSGALGDRGPHQIDPALTALKLGYPTKVSAESAPVTAESPPEWSIVRFEFPGREQQPPVTLTWYDGGRQPPAEITGIKSPPPNGTLLLGNRARLFVPELGGMPRLLPLPGRDLPRLPELPAEQPVDHVTDWLEACKHQRSARCDFAFGARLTEVCLLGNLALRTGRTITWDGRTGQAIHLPEAEKFLDRTYRKGWALPAS